MFLQIDEDGFFLSGETRYTDASICGPALLSLRYSQNGSLTTRFGDSDVLIEAFDEPYVATQVHLENDSWWIQLPYGLKLNFDLSSLSLDEWDRFHGYSENKIPFVLTRKAQNEFFNLLTEFDDDSITWNQKKFIVPPYWSNETQITKENFWSDIYRGSENPGWNLETAAEALKDMLPRIKLPRSRILVLGCGAGHDAALFAREGHIVTAVDFSKEAIQKAKQKYSQHHNLQFLEKNVFELPADWKNSFDLVIEHTCYCAINPQSRGELAKIWHQLLAQKGQLMGVFFAMEARKGPPFGGTEWELRERLRKNFDFLFWGRWRNSIPQRQGRELFVLAQKKGST